MLRHRLMQVAVGMMAIVAASAVHPVRPAVGSKIDNYLNHNLPFLTVDYSTTNEWEEWHPAAEIWLDRSETHSYGFHWEYYDEMDAREKLMADSNTGFTSLLGAVGSTLSGAAFAAVSTSLWEATAAGLAIEVTTASQVGSGLFGGVISDLLGWGNSAGSW